MSFNVTTNNVTGYALSISAKSGTDLTNSAAGTKITSLSTTDGINSTTFDTTTYNNQWGFKPNYYKSVVNSNKFYPSPTTSGVTLNKTESANTDADTYTIAIGARATYAQVAGTYSNTYVLNAVGNYPKYSFTYIDSLTDNTISTDTSAGTSTTATLASAPSKDNYEFKGWCTVNNSSDPSQCKNASGTAGTTYAAGASFSLSTLSANALNFYTIWEQLGYAITAVAGSNVTSVSVNGGTAASSITGTYAEGTELTITATTSNYIYTWSNSASNGTLSKTSEKTIKYTVGTGPSTITVAANTTRTYIQDYNMSRCSADASSTNTIVNVYDKRDGKDYSVRYINGGCWMTQNLRFTETSITPATTNINAPKTLTYYDLDSSVSGSTYSGHCDSTNGYNYACIQDSGDALKGAWYNYAAASAMTVTSKDNSMPTAYDVCPKNWRLPTGPNATNNTDLNKLIGNTTSGWQSPTTGLAAFNATIGGYYWNGSVANSETRWWSASAYTTATRYDLTYNNDNGKFGGNSYSYSYNGEFIRCVRTTNPTLYNTVATMAKGTQTAADLQAAIVTPTESAPISSNSGVYEYNSSVFGTSSDAANDYKIYYYRGILDTYSGMGSYGSDGQADAYPNYVKLANNTCWRIVRTTGSGGVKMIYNGTYGATTSGSCANSPSNAQTGFSAFDTTADSSGKSIVGVGYTYNADYKSTASSIQAGTLFGANSSYSSNSTNSSIKTYIEDTWYKTNMGDAYTSILESSAGYCNDRSVNSGASWTSYSDTTSITTPYTSYSAGNTIFYFGPYMRNYTTYQTITLGCPRNAVDLYTSSSADDGNRQLTYPVALLTADEASFAGSGGHAAANGSSCHTNSYLNSHSEFRLFSPSYRGSGGYADGFVLLSTGYLDYSYLYFAMGVRPAISLTPGTLIYSGSGTATDPWTIPQPAIESAKYMQNVTTAMVDELNDNYVTTLTDGRDGQSYTVKKINGQLWMTRNLAIGCNGSGSTYGSSVKSVQLTPTDSNVFTAYSTPTLLLSDSTYGGSLNGYYFATMECDSTYGAWYNYKAATAGTISGNPNNADVTEDICPFNWHLPTGWSAAGDTDFTRLIGNANLNLQDATPGLMAFNATASGVFYSGGLGSSVGKYGAWWSSTAIKGNGNDSTYARSLYYLADNNQFNGSSINQRYYGLSIRCVHD